MRDNGISISLYIEDRDSQIRVAERKETDRDDRWDYDNLVVRSHEATFSLRTKERPAEDEYPFIVELSTHHAVNDETGRGFHATIEMPLARQDLMKLRAFLDAMLA